MTDLATLIEYWRNNYQINYTQHSMTTNNHIWDTIQYLKQLQKQQGVIK